MASAAKSIVMGSSQMLLRATGERCCCRIVRPPLSLLVPAPLHTGGGQSADVRPGQRGGRGEDDEVTMRRDPSLKAAHQRWATAAGPQKADGLTVDNVITA